MPGKNCCIPNCSTSRRHPGISIFNVPRGDDEFSTGWRKKLIDIVTKYRLIDPSFKAAIEKKNVAICEKHFTNEVKIFRKLERVELEFLMFSVYTFSPLKSS